MIRYYIIINFGDVSPELRGPYKTETHRVRAARRYKKADPGEHNALMRLTVHGDRPVVDSFFGYELAER